MAPGVVAGTSDTAMDGAIGEEGGKVVAAAVERERRCRESDKLAPPLFVD